MTHVEDVNTMVNLHKYLNELARSTKTEGLRGFYMRQACAVKEEMKARGINRSTLMKVKA
jgi:hypothetical protein